VFHDQKCIITSKCCAGISVVREIPSQMLHNDPKLFLDLKSSQDCFYVINFGQLHFRKKGSDKNDASLGLHRIHMICGFVFTSDQICSAGFLVIGSIVGAYFSHGLVYIHAYLGCIQVCSCFQSSTPKVQFLLITAHCMIVLWNEIIQSY